MPELPNFLVIGAQKAGTYSLHHYLSTHPAIEMSQRRKEVNFFVEELNWKRGLSWYAEHWRGDTLLRGESSTRYSMRDRHPNVPEKIHASLSHAKLIYVVRDPIKRLISQYVHEFDDWKEHRSFEAMLCSATREKDLNTSCYHYQLRAYLDFFPPEHIHVVCFEELVADPAPTMCAVFDFLGAGSDFTHPDWGLVFNDSSDKRRETTTGRLMRRLVGRRPLRRNAWLRETFTLPIEKPVFDPVRHADIVAMYREDAARLAAFTGRRFDHWRELNPAP